MPATPHLAASRLLLLAVFFAALVLLAAYFAAMNWWGFLANIRNRRRGIHKHYSPAPFLSAVVAVSVSVAASNWGFFPVARWILIIPALDIGNWQVLIALAMLLTGRPGKNKETSPQLAATRSKEMREVLARTFYALSSRRQWKNLINRLWTERHKKVIRRL